MQDQLSIEKARVAILVEERDDLLRKVFELEEQVRRLTPLAPDSPYVCLHCGAHISSEHLPWCKSLPQNGGR